MRRILKWLGLLLAAVVLVALVVVGLAWRISEKGLARVYASNDPPLTMLRDPQTLAQGAHLFVTHGCADCHGANGAGRLVFDAGPVLKLVAPNITPGGAHMHDHSADEIAAIIRNGVKPDGHSLVFMPVADFHEMSDVDTAALVAYVQSLPASNNDPGPYAIRPLGRVLYWLGNFPLVAAETVDHTPHSRSAPVVAVSADYGKYLAQGCTGCHGKNFAGQHVPGTPPEFADSANLTPHENGLKDWTQADFVRALREGKRPDGRELDPFMPWKAIGQMSDQELAAIWTYLRTLPPEPGKKKKA
jgi:cytochrome c553